MIKKTNYIVRVNSCPKWKNYKAATLAMCMGNSNWQGEKFVTVLEWAARNFEFIRIDLSDSLGRFNDMASGMPETEALKKNLQLGSDWINQHSVYLRNCGKPYSIVRWDRWRNHSAFEEVRSAFEFAALKDLKFASALEADVQTYAERIRARGEKVPDGWSNACHAYLIEELSGITMQARDIESSGGMATTRVYPSEEPKSSFVVRAGEIESAPVGLEQEYYTAININRRKMSSYAFAA